MQALFWLAHDRPIDLGLWLAGSLPNELNANPDGQRNYLDAHRVVIVEDQKAEPSIDITVDEEAEFIERDEFHLVTATPAVDLIGHRIEMGLVEFF